MNTVVRLFDRGIALAEAIPHSLVTLVTRIAIALVFWRSGQTKVTGWTINESTYDLFRYEYQVPVIPPDIAAVLATVQEHLFAVLLVIGFASRLSALGLIGMTAVIQVFVYPASWPDHLLWFACLLFIVARGPGAASIDHLLRRRLPPHR